MGIVNKRRPHLSSFLEPSLCYTFALDPPASLLISIKVTAHQNQIDPRPPHQVTFKKILTLSFSKQNFKNCVDGGAHCRPFAPSPFDKSSSRTSFRLCTIPYNQLDIIIKMNV